MINFNKSNTYNKHKDHVYSIILSLIKNYNGPRKHIMDMPWLNFTLIQEILNLNKNFIIHSYEKYVSTYNKQKKIRKNLNISGHKVKLFNEEVHLGFINNQQRIYALSFLDFCGRMCKTMATSLSYANSHYVVLTVRLGREQDYWNDMLHKDENRHTTHEREFHRAGFEEIRDYYDYPSDQGTNMRVYFLKKINYANKRNL